MLVLSKFFLRKKETKKETIWKLKADRPHPRNYPQMSTDYRHTDNHLRPVMVVADGRMDPTKRIIILLR